MADIDTIERAIEFVDSVEEAIEDTGQDVPDGTDAEEYAEFIRNGGGGGNITVDQTYNPESKNAQSGIAVAEAMESLPIKHVVSPDENGNKLDVYSLESGTYILEGKFSPHPNSTSTLTFSSGQLVAIRKGSVSTVAQVFYPPNNAIQYLEIKPDETNEKGYSYTRKDAKLVDMETIANRTTTVNEESDDEHYPSAKAVYDAMELKRIESLDTENMKYMRDIESGYYLMHGYFKPFPNSDSTVIIDTMCVSVARQDDGSHLMAFSPLNFKIRCYEILVDDTAEEGFVFNSWMIKLLDLEPLPQKVTDLETQVGNFETALDAAIALCDSYINGGVA